MVHFCITAVPGMYLLAFIPLFKAATQELIAAGKTGTSSSPTALSAREVGQGHGPEALA